AEELEEISHKLKEDGLDIENTDQEKSSLKVALNNITELQQQQAEEMKEFENYVEHVRQLSAEREALTVEFVAENDQLKAENDRMRQELESFKSNETRDMLLQQGLDEIAHGTTSEQIAYLLVERARLMDELEAEEQRHLIETPDGLMSAEQLQKQLDQERQEFETELRRQREMMNHSIETLKSNHEEEISNLVTENHHLQAMLNDVKGQLTADAPALKSSEEYKVYLYVQIILEIEQLRVELQREKTRSKEYLDEYEETLRKLREERNQQQEYINDLQIKIQKFNAEKKSNELKINFMEKELEDLREQERNRVNKQKSLLSHEDNTQVNNEILTLRNEKKDIEEKLENAKALLLEEKQNVLDFETQLKLAEGEQRATNAKVKVLESQVLYLEEKIETDKLNEDHSTGMMSSGISKLTLEQAINEKNSLEQDLGEQKQQNAKIQLEVDASRKQIQRLEDIISRQEKENDDLMKKFHEARNDYVQLERTLLEEKDKCKEKNAEKDSQLNEAHSELDKLQLELQRVTSELHSKTNQITQLQLELDIQKTQTECIKEASEKQADSLRDQLENALIENKRLKRDIEEKMKLLDALREDVAKLRPADVMLESSVPESDMSWFDKDTKKFLLQNKPEELNKKIVDLEMKNQELKNQLDETHLVLAGAKEELSFIKGERNGETLIAQTHSDVIENMLKAGSDSTLYALQQELIEAKLKLEYAERDLNEMASIKEQLYQKQEEVMQLQNQLQEEKFNRSLAGISSDEINNQLMTTRQHEHQLQQKNTELQLKLLDVETKLETINKQTEFSSKERAKLSLKRELEWKECLDDKYHALLLEKRDLLYHSKFLEEENNTLQQRMDSLVRQKQNLDRMINDYQFERHKEVTV
ncbi:hypothetical protein LSH36_114g06011, partial [Paralvinella palmiformis]